MKKADILGFTKVLLARKVGTTVTYLHPDHLGSNETGTDSVGGIAWRETHTPFGEVINPAAANDNEAAYTGHIRDAATGLNYMQARYQDPVIGRFLSIDPVGFTPDRPFIFNRYAYVGNDAINAWDPDGENQQDPIQTSVRFKIVQAAKGFAQGLLAPVAAIANANPNNGLTADLSTLNPTIFNSGDAQASVAGLLAGSVTSLALGSSAEAAPKKTRSLPEGNR